MYADFYNFSRRPFQLSPDPSFFFSSRGHQKALAYLTFGLNEREGFIVITGEVGAGKTTLVGHLMGQIDNDRFLTANIVTTQVEADDSLRLMTSAFGLPFEEKDKATLLRQIEGFLIDQHRFGKHVVLVVDEAQNLTPSALEELRMLSNYQSGGRSLFQCFLVGQPQFRAIMAHPAMEQLRQRVIASCHLEPMNPEELHAYIEHRLRTVGWKEDPSFTKEAYKLIHSYSGGVPRRVNTLCGRLLLFGYLEGLHSITAENVEEVVSELSNEGTLKPLGEEAEENFSNSATIPANLVHSDGSKVRFENDFRVQEKSYKEALVVLSNRIAALGGKR
tara:strand:- start:6352 stop:7350 length:999 start_codon:yes stop_codon:yes gene_type:complete